MSFKKWLRGGKDEEPENKTGKENQGTPPVQENTPPADIPGVPISLEDITRGMQYAPLRPTN